MFNVPSISGKTIGDGSHLWFEFVLSAGTSNATSGSSIGIQTGTFDIAHVSFVEGDATAEANPFAPRHIGQEWELCQRYYEKGAFALRMFSQYGTDIRRGFTVRKRVAPAMALYDLTYSGGVTAATAHTPASEDFGQRAIWPNTAVYGSAGGRWTADAEF